MKKQWYRVTYLTTVSPEKMEGYEPKGAKKGDKMSDLAVFRAGSNFIDQVLSKPDVSQEAIEPRFRDCSRGCKPNIPNGFIVGGCPVHDMMFLQDCKPLKEKEECNCICHGLALDIVSYAKKTCKHCRSYCYPCEIDPEHQERHDAFRKPLDCVWANKPDAICLDKDCGYYLKNHCQPPSPIKGECVVCEDVPEGYEHHHCEDLECPKRNHKPSPQPQSEDNWEKELEVIFQRPWTSGELKDFIKALLKSQRESYQQEIVAELEKYFDQYRSSSQKGSGGRRFGVANFKVGVRDLHDKLLAILEQEKE